MQQLLARPDIKNELLEELVGQIRSTNGGGPRN